MSAVAQQGLDPVRLALASQLVDIENRHYAGHEREFIQLMLPSAQKIPQNPESLSLRMAEKISAIMARTYTAKELEAKIRFKLSPEGHSLDSKALIWMQKCSEGHQGVDEKSLSPGAKDLLNVWLRQVDEISTESIREAAEGILKPPIQEAVLVALKDRHREKRKEMVALMDQSCTFKELNALRVFEESPEGRSSDLKRLFIAARIPLLFTELINEKA